jgi:hypothetical protein
MNQRIKQKTDFLRLFALDISDFYVIFQLINLQRLLHAASIPNGNIMVWFIESDTIMMSKPKQPEKKQHKNQLQKNVEGFP